MSTDAAKKPGVLDRVESWAKIIGVAVACFGVWKYYDQIEQGRIDKSIAYFDEYHRGALLNARADIGAASIRWLKVAQREPKPPLEAFIAMTLADLRSNELWLQSEIVVEFYDRLAACAALNACDADTALRLFSAEAREFQGLIGPLIAYVREEGDQNFASGLECFAAGGGCVFQET